MKTLDDYFHDWESHVFGFGYGTGEEHTLATLKGFVDALDNYRNYDYRTLETALTPPVAWLMINILCRAGVIEYGTSPRFAWLNPWGENMARFVAEKSVEQLYEITSRDENYIPCFPDHCNCDDGGDCKKQNPFWKGAPPSAINTPGAQ